MRYYFYIYKITSPSGRVYIGQTKWIKSRKSYYKRGKCEKQFLIYRSIKKYGWKTHTFEIILEGWFTKDEINKLEINNIKIYKDLGISLNISDGGNLAIHRLGLNGKAVLQFDKSGVFIREWRCIADIKRELKLCAEGIAIQCRTNKYYYKGFFWIYKKDYKGEYTDKFLPYRSNNKIPVIVFNLQKEVIGVFDSLSDACRNFNLDVRDVSHSIKLGYWFKEMFFVKKYLYHTNYEIPNYGITKKVIFVDSSNNIYKFNSVTEAAKFLNVTTSLVIYYCSGKNKKHKYNLKYAK